AHAGAAALDDQRLLRRAGTGRTRPAGAGRHRPTRVEVGRTATDTVLMVLATTRTVTLTVDGQQITVPDGTTIWAAAKAAGIDIPVLCHDERYDPVGVCRMSVVATRARAYAPPRFPTHAPRIA